MQGRIPICISLIRICTSFQQQIDCLRSAIIRRKQQNHQPASARIIKTPHKLLQQSSTHAHFITLIPSPEILLLASFDKIFLFNLTCGSYASSISSWMIFVYPSEHANCNAVCPELFLSYNPRCILSISDVIFGRFFKRSHSKPCTNCIILVVVAVLLAFTGSAIS